MSALLLLSTVLLLVALAGCAVLWNRSGETRVGLFGALFLLIAAHQAVTAWTNWSDPLGWNRSSLGSLIGLAVGFLGVLAVVALWRTLAERDRAEKLHWDSMETVRIIDELNESDSMSPDAKIAEVLGLGIARLGLAIAMVARVRDEWYEVIAIHAPEHFPIAAGATFPLAETFCKDIVDSDRPVGVERISESSATAFREGATFGFEAYLGAPIHVDGATYGTLSFASFEPRTERFTGTEKDLVRLMAQCVGSELAKREASSAPAADPVAGRTPAVHVHSPANAPQPALAGAGTTKTYEAPLPAGKRPDSRYAERVIDPNRILQRIANELRRLAGDSVKLSFNLHPDLGFAAAQNVPFAAIARTLVMHARDAMPRGGELVIESANLEIAGGESGQLPAVAPDRYVTISFRDSGEEPDADTLARLFDQPPRDAEQPGGDGRLPLSTVYRILQICGGDLSVKVEPGHGSTFTVFLPRAREPVRNARKAISTVPPAMSRTTPH